MLSVSLQQVRTAGMVASLLLTVPLVLTLANPASRLRGGPGSVGFDWMPGSFLIMGAILFATALGIQLAVTRLTTPAARLLAIFIGLGVFGLIWIELAVDGVSQLLS